MKRIRSALVLAFLLGLVTGCGVSPLPSRVKGKITYKGEVVKGGQIRYHHADKGTYNAAIKSDGTYEIVDMPTGSYGVSIETESMNPNTKVPSYGKGGAMDKQTAERIKAAGQDPAAVLGGGGQQMKNKPFAEALAERYTKIPVKYKSPTTSDLTVNLEKGENVKDLDLTD